MSDIQVAILTGSDSDLPEISAAAKMLEQFGVRFEMRILSAHRTPEQTAQYVEDAEARGARVFICAAGMAAHLAGAVAAHTCRPVIGVPMGGGLMGGLDALLSTVQMPAGIPVLTTAVGKSGATNAGLAAVQILACADKALAAKFSKYRKDMTKKVLAKDSALQEKGWRNYKA